MPRTFAGEAWGVAVYRPPECYEILPAVDGAAGIVADGPSTRRLGSGGGCQIVPRIQMPIGA